MVDLEDYVGQVLDDKYRLERKLGQGGMGAVYLATHLGTERYVALKLITPQFMHNEEFVQRFKREARAAGRLRHPNVVDVTDFGFAQAGGETVAYLVMEYLDGCTLADVLSEEKRLPLEWVVDILEQVCSAVHEAHQQGVVHRDLKPENIWLEPNRLGSYRVKVLDFGIAKLGEANTWDLLGSEASVSAAMQARTPGAPTSAFPAATHLAGSPEFSTAIPGAAAMNETNVTGNLEPDTLLYSTSSSGVPSANPSEGGLVDEHSNSEAVQTKLFGRPAKTNVGSSAISAEGTVDVRTGNTQSDDGGYDVDGDITLMLGEATRRLVGNSANTSKSGTSPRIQLTQLGAIMGTPTFMSPEQCGGKNLDARSDIYSLGVIAYQMLAGDPPFTGDTAGVMRGHIEAAPQPLRERARKVPKRVAKIVMAALAKDPADRPQTAASFASSLRAQAEGIGSLYRRAFALYSEYFPKFVKLSFIAHIPVIITTLFVIGLQLAEKSYPVGLGFVRVSLIVGLVVCALLQVASFYVASAAISGMTAVIVTQLSAAPLRPVELRKAFAVLKTRWRAFLKTSIRVTLRIIIGLVLLVVPGLVVFIRYSLYAPVVLMEGLEKKAAMRRARELASRSWRTVIIVSLLQFLIPMTVNMLVGRLSVGVHRQSAGSTQGIHFQDVYQQLSGLISILIMPLTSIVPALLYLKMRQLGGETINAALAQIDEADGDRSEWQQRMRTRPYLNTPRSRTPSA